MADTKSKAFVLMPFSENLKEVYEEVYKKTCSENGFDCWRVDEISRPGSITRDIVEGIIEADVIIADLSTRNANVFYELGIAHTLGKKTIMTSQTKDDVPFDIANYRVIFYKQTIIGAKELKLALGNTLRDLKKVLVESSNPVQMVLSQRTIFGTKRKTPILEIINVSKLPKSIRNLFDDERIIYPEDLKHINFDKAKEKYNLGNTSMGYLMKIILTAEAYDDYEDIHNYIVKNRINTEGPRDDFIIRRKT